MTQNQGQQLLNEHIFHSIEQLRAGTFKFSRNKHYTPNMKDFEEKMIREFNRNQSYSNSHSMSQENLMRLRQEYVQKKISEYRPHIKYQKTFVEIFPFLYDTLDAGANFGNRKSLQLIGKMDYKNPEDGSEEVIHQKASIKFCTKGNKLLKYEESRQK